jgi:hypothetical protein
MTELQSTLIVILFYNTSLIAKWNTFIGCAFLSFQYLESRRRILLGNEE